MITDGLQAREVGHTALPDLRVVATMHERKALMASLSDAFVALPGGAGTLDEFFEAWTWTQLGIHRKPVAVLNVAGTSTACSPFSSTPSTSGSFARNTGRPSSSTTDPARLLDRLANIAPVRSDKWLDRDDPPRP